MHYIIPPLLLIHQATMSMILKSGGVSYTNYLHFHIEFRFLILCTVYTLLNVQGEIIFIYVLTLHCVLQFFACTYLCCIRKQYRDQSEVQAALLDILILDL